MLNKSLKIVIFYIFVLLSLLYINIFTTFIQDRYFTNDTTITVGEYKNILEKKKELEKNKIKNLKEYLKYSNTQTSISLNFQRCETLPDTYLICAQIKRNVLIFKFVYCFISFVAICCFLLLLKKVKNNKYSFEEINLKDILLINSLSIYPWLFLYLHNFDEMSAFIAIPLIIALYLFSLASFFILNFFLKQKFLSLLLVVFFVYNCLIFSKIFYYNYLMIFIIWAIIILLLSFFKIKNIVKIFAISILFVQLFFFTFDRVSKIYREICYTHKNQINWKGKYKLEQQSKRDIYIILLDSYSGNNFLKSVGFDNFKFINFLKQKGFFVYENISSNYNLTMYSVPSFLNFEYMDNNHHNNYEIGSYKINNAKLFQISKLSGYKNYYFNNAEVCFSIKPNYLIDSMLYKKESTFTLSANDIETLYHFLEPITFISNLVNVNLFKMQAKVLEKDWFFVENKKDKKLCFYHIMAPHMPYVFDENGNRNDISKLSNDAFYVGYLKYINKKIEEVVNYLLSQQNKPIIIIMGDHGARFYGHYYDIKEDLFNLEKLYSHFNTFLAYYNPDENMEKYKKKKIKTLINFFIDFSNSTFGTDMKYVKDENFILRQEGRNYKATNFTEKYKECVKYFENRYIFLKKN